MSNVSTNWKTLSQKKILQTPYMEVWEDEVEQPNGRITKYYVRRKPPFSVIIPIHEDGKLTLVRQYRYNVSAITLEFSMGSVKGANPEETAGTELEEETGLRAEKLTLLHSYFAGVGHTDQETYVYVAEGLTQGEPRPEEGEFFDIETYTFDEVSKMIDSGEIKEAHTIVAFHYLEAYLKKR